MLNLYVLFAAMIKHGCPSQTMSETYTRHALFSYWGTRTTTIVESLIEWVKYKDFTKKKGNIRILRYHAPKLQGSCSYLCQDWLLNVNNLTLFNGQDCGLMHISGTFLNRRVRTKCNARPWATVTPFKMVPFTVLMLWKWGARAKHWIPWKLAEDNNDGILTSTRTIVL